MGIRGGHRLFIRQKNALLALATAKDGRKIGCRGGGGGEDRNGCGQKCVGAQFPRKGPWVCVSEDC